MDDRWPPGPLVSVTANALHAIVAADASVPGLLAAAVVARPPLVLLTSIYLTVVLIRSAKTRPTADPAMASAVESGPTVPASADRPAAAPPGLLPEMDVEGQGPQPSTVGQWIACAYQPMPPIPT